MESEVVVEGIWCRACLLLEDDDDIINETCAGCGCSKDEHVGVKVVTT